MSKIQKPKTKGGIVFEDKHLTKQDHGRMADINYIAQQYADGRLPYPDVPPPVFGDVSSIDVQNSMYLAAAAKSAVSELPSEAREVFNHDPSEYAAFLEDNAADIESRGLARVLYEFVNPVDPVEESSKVSPETKPAETEKETVPPVPESGTE